MDPTPPLSSPDITNMQKLVVALTAVIAAGLGAATSFGVHLTVEQDTKILGLWGALGGLMVVADAIIRQGRAKAHAAITIAKAAQAAPAVVAKKKPAAKKP